MVSIKKEWIDRLVFHPAPAKSDDQKKPEENTDTLRFRNGDRASGAVTGITEKTLIVETEYGKIEIQREALVDIVFAKEKKEKPPRPGMELEATFVGGDKIRGTLLRLDDEHVEFEVGFSEKFQAARWALQKLEFLRPRDN